jgi:hypothetical protein
MSRDRVKMIALNLLNSKYLTSRFALPISSLLQRPVKFNGSRRGTFIDASAAIPAFVGVQDYRRLTFLGIGYVDVHRTDLDTAVTSVADFSLENYRPAGCSHIGKRIYFFDCHKNTPVYFL